MNKPRNGKVKPKVDYAAYADVKLHLPKDPYLYRLRRVYWLLLNQHRLLEKDPTAINTKSYLELLDLYTKLAEDAAKKGLGTREGRINARTRKRMDEERVAENGDEDTTSGVGAPFPAGLGS